MQLRVITLLAALAAPVFAIPSDSSSNQNGTTPDNVKEFLHYSYDGCKVVECGLSLGVPILPCAFALVAVGTNIIDDMSCAIAGLASAAFVPETCHHCHEAFDHALAEALLGSNPTATPSSDDCTTAPTGSVTIPASKATTTAS